MCHLGAFLNLLTLVTVPILKFPQGNPHHSLLTYLTIPAELPLTFLLLSIF